MENCRNPNKEQRLKAYKKALNDIEKNEPLPGNPCEPYLCILLPVFLWNLKNYYDDAPDGLFWSYLDTTEIFPEFTKKHIEDIQSFNHGKRYTDNHIDLKDEMRMKILKEIIKSLEK